MTRAADFRADLVEWHRAVAEMVKLARKVPGGLDRLRAFGEAHKGNFCIQQPEVRDGAVVQVSRPSPECLVFLDQLRADARGQAA